MTVRQGIQSRTRRDTSRRCNFCADIRTRSGIL